MPPAFAFADEQIVGPAQVGGEAACGANGLGRGEARSQWQQRQAGSREVGPQQHADVEALPRSRVPGVVAASAACALLVGEEDGAVRSAGARGVESVSVGGAGDGRESQVAGEDGAGERLFEGGEIVHGQAGSATMLMEMSAAPADWVSAPTLMNSTPVSA